MVRTQNEAIDLAKKYLTFVRKVFFIEKAYLFGSYAKNTQHEWSDIDVAIVSRDFNNIPRSLSMKFLTKMTLEVDTSIEPIVIYSEEDSSPVVGTVAYEVVTTGILL